MKFTRRPEWWLSMLGSTRCNRSDYRRAYDKGLTDFLAWQHRKPRCSFPATSSRSRNWGRWQGSETGAITYYYPVDAQIRTNRVRPKTSDDRMARPGDQH